MRQFRLLCPKLLHFIIYYSLLLITTAHTMDEQVSQCDKKESEKPAALPEHEKMQCDESVPIKESSEEQSNTVTDNEASQVPESSKNPLAGSDTGECSAGVAPSTNNGASVKESEESSPTKSSGDHSSTDVNMEAANQMSGDTAKSTKETVKDQSIDVNMESANQMAGDNARSTKETVKDQSTDIDMESANQMAGDVRSAGETAKDQSTDVVMETTKDTNNQKSGDNTELTENTDEQSTKDVEMKETANQKSEDKNESPNQKSEDKNESPNQKSENTGESTDKTVSDPDIETEQKRVSKKPKTDIEEDKKLSDVSQEKDTVEDEAKLETEPASGASHSKPSYQVYKDLPDQAKLEKFGYKFNEDGELRNINDNSGYKFMIKPNNHSYNQKKYEALGEVITEYVYDLLETRCLLKKKFIPVDAAEDDPRGFIFMSDDALTNPDKLLVLINGAGVVRAGQWTRKLIINESLEKGTQIPYIEKAKKDGYGIIVLNTNLNYVGEGRERQDIKNNETPEDHGDYVWKHVISTAQAKNIFIVAHSYGGIVTVEMAKSVPDEFVERVTAIGFTDSVHLLQWQAPPKKVLAFFKKHARNWVSSTSPRDTKQRKRPNDCPAISAGHKSHEWTSYAAFESVFKFFEEQYQKKEDGTYDDSEPEEAEEAINMNQTD